MDVFPARRHGLASGLPCKAAPYLFRGSDGVRAVFRQLDGCAHAPACLRDGRRPASAAVRDVPDCTRAFRRDACKRNSAVRYRGLVHLPGRLSNGAVKIRRTGRSSGFYVACRGKKMPPDGTRKSEGPAKREFLCRRLGRPVLGGCPRAEAKQRAFPKREMPAPVRGRSLRIFYTEAEVYAHT